MHFQLHILFAYTGCLKLNERLPQVVFNFILRRRVKFRTQCPIHARYQVRIHKRYHPSNKYSSSFNILALINVLSAIRRQRIHVHPVHKGRLNLSVQLNIMEYWAYDLINYPEALLLYEGHMACRRFVRVALFLDRVVEEVAR
jgi:hypothetical protein